MRAVNDERRCAAVVRIAYIMGARFSCFNGRDGTFLVVASGPSWWIASDCTTEDARVLGRLLAIVSSGVWTSTMGHTKPVRGTYSGRYFRSVSSEDWRECAAVSYFKNDRRCQRVCPKLGVAGPDQSV